VLLNTKARQHLAVYCEGTIAVQDKANIFDVPQFGNFSADCFKGYIRCLFNRVAENTGGDSLTPEIDIFINIYLLSYVISTNYHKSLLQKKRISGINRVSVNNKMTGR